LLAIVDWKTAFTPVHTCAQFVSKFLSDNVNDKDYILVADV